MNEPPNISTPAVLPVKRKRGRPRKEGNLPKMDEGSSQTPPLTSVPEWASKVQHVEGKINDAGSIVGRMVSGVIDGSFDAGYFLSVRIGNAGPLLRGVVFEPGRYTPVTSTNDIAPQIKMHQRRELPIPVLNQQNRGNDVGSQSENIAKQPVQLGKQPSLGYCPVLPSMQQPIASFVLRNQSASAVIPANVPRNSSSPTLAEKMVMLQNPQFNYGNQVQSSNPVENIRGVEQDMMQVYEVSVQSEGLTGGTKAAKDMISESLSAERVYNALPHKEIINQVHESHKQNVESGLTPSAPIHNELNRSGVEHPVAMEHQSVNLETHTTKSEIQQYQPAHIELKDPYYTLRQHTVIAEPQPLRQEPPVIERGFQPRHFIQNKLQDTNLELHETPIVAQSQYIPLENQHLESELQTSTTIENEIKRSNHELNYTPTVKEMQSDSMKPENMKNELELSKSVHNEVESQNHGIHQDFVTGNSHFLVSNLMPQSGGFMVEKPNSPKSDTKTSIQLTQEAKITGQDQISNSGKPIHHIVDSGELESQTSHRTREALPFDLEIAAEESSWPGRPENQVSSSET